MNSYYNVYQEIKNKMSYNLENYVELDVPYTINTHQILMEILNTRKYFDCIISRVVKISKREFESNIPNNRVAISYIDLDNAKAICYMCHDEKDGTSSYLLVQEQKIILFFEIKL